MPLGGFAGNILFVDLTHMTVRTEPLDAALAERFIGGFGLTVKLAVDRLSPGTAPLSPENPAVIGLGPLVGTGLPSTSRVFAVSKLPSSGTVGWCGAGGVNFGFQLKNAGFDHVVIEGRAERPVYLKLVDGRVSIEDATSLWGMGIEKTCQALWADYPPPAGVLAIGPAGENRVRFSMASIDRAATLGRGGFGAVLGSKNLKAVLVRGDRGIQTADRARYKDLCQTLLDTIREYPYLGEWQELGMIKSFPLIDREIYARIKKRRLACVSCPIGCKEIVGIPDGEFAGFTTHTSSTINRFTPVMYGMSDYREAIRLVAGLDGYGMDMFEFFGLMNLAGNLVQAGIMPDEGPDIDLGSYASMAAWADKIAKREGSGDLLADGFAAVLAEFGTAAEEHAPALIKGMHPYAGPGTALPWDRFGTMELGQVLDPRGPHVGSGGSPTYFALRPIEVFPRHFERMGVPAEAHARILPPPESPGAERALKVGRLLKYAHNWFTILGSLGICARAQVNRFYRAEVCAELYEAVTGIPTDLDKLRERADRVWTCLRVANRREGASRLVHEALPRQWFTGSGFKDYLSGEPLTRQDAESMIEDYFREWGWDAESGAPTPETLARLGLGKKKG